MMRLGIRRIQWRTSDGWALLDFGGGILVWWHSPSGVVA